MIAVITPAVQSTRLHVVSHHQRHSQLTSPRNWFSLRLATINDLDAILDVVHAAMPLDPQWDYRFPHRREYPTDHRDATQKRYVEFLTDETDRWTVIVAENREGKVIAFAVWDFGMLRTGGVSDGKRACTLANANLPQPTVRKRRDADEKRVKEWTTSMQISKKNLFDASLGKYIQLQILATHPDYQRLGAGSSLCRDGIRVARILNAPIAVFASPMGRKLYLSLGFRAVATVNVHVDGESESIEVAAMAIPVSKKLSTTPSRQR